MRVLIIVENSPAQRYLVKLYAEGLIKEMKELINSSKYSQAAALAFTKGSYQGEVYEDELSRNSARWDLTK